MNRLLKAIGKLLLLWLAVTIVLFVDLFALAALDPMHVDQHPSYQQQNYHRRMT